MRHISLQFTHSSIKSSAFDRLVSGDAEAIRHELNAHNEIQRARYRARAARTLVSLARQQGRSYLNAVGVA